MISSLFSRLLQALLSLSGASFVAFVLLRQSPGDPARLFLGPFASYEALQALRQDLGLNGSLLSQFMTYLEHFIQGDWGYSYSMGQPVAVLLASRFPATLELGLYAFSIAFLLAVPTALIAVHRGGVTDIAARTLSFLSMSVPSFWLGLLLLLLFFEGLGWLPGPEGRLALRTALPPTVSGFYTVDSLIAGDMHALVDAFRHLVLPAFTLAVLPYAFLFRLLRANLTDVLHQPYLLVARSRGLTRWSALVRHALPNAFLPTLTASGLIFGQLLAGSVLTERVFAWPGVGALVTDGVLKQDFSVVQAFILLSAAIYVFVNFAVDALACVIDPRLAKGGSP